MAIYNITFSLVAERLIPPFLRRPKSLAWLTALVKPLQTLRADYFVTFRAEKILQTKYNSQKIVLEMLLNDLVGLSSEIYIDNIRNNIDHMHLYRSDEGYIAKFTENEALMAGTPVPLYFYNEAEYLPAYDFIVYVPTAYMAAWEQRIRAEVEKYKLAGITYTVTAY